MLLTTLVVAQSCVIILPRGYRPAIHLSGSYSPKGIRGNGQIIREEVAVSDYSEIHLSVPGEILYRQAPDNEPYLEIVADENILPLLEIESVKNCLKIKCRDNKNIHPSQLTVYTNSSYLSRIEVAGSGKVHLKEKVESSDMGIRISGSGKVVSDDLSCEKIRLAITGSGNIKLQGTGGNASCTITGSGNIDVSGYPVRNANCRITGSGKALACAEEKLTAEITGSGHVEYRGNPQIINTRITGSGNIIKLKDKS
jgi:hypothetical protein